VAVDILFILGGLVGLFVGGEWLVKGATRLARSFGISALVVGLTVVAFGTSTPELLVSLSAVLGGTQGISIGNVIGSNIANIGLILGATGLVFPIAVRAILLKREIPILLIVTFLSYFIWFDGDISRLDGTILMIGLIAFNVFMIVNSRQRLADPESDMSVENLEIQEDEGEIIEPSERMRELGRLMIGIVILGIGAQLTVEGSVSLARAFGISELVIGITLVAVGTSLPELATSLVAAFRQQSDIAIGNVVGSNLYNLMGILGITAIIQPINLERTAIDMDPFAVLSQPFSVDLTPFQHIIWVDGPAMIIAALLLLPFVMNRKIERYEALFLLTCYTAYIIYAVVR